jgi:hypothetical protein
VEQAMPLFFASSSGVGKAVMTAYPNSFKMVPFIKPDRAVCNFGLCNLE